MSKNKTQLEQEYNKKVVPSLKKELKVKNDMAVPSLEKVIVNAGIGSEYRTNSGIVDEMTTIVSSITGQRPVVTNAKVSVSNFKVREGMPNGIKVTLRGDKMWEFLYKLIHITLPRIKDFRGISRKSFDKRGNYTLGIRDHTIFPEIDSSTVIKLRPLQIIINTTTSESNSALVLLEKLGLPFERIT